MKREPSFIERLAAFAEFGEDMKRLLDKLSDEHTKTALGRLLRGLGKKLIEVGDQLESHHEDDDHERHHHDHDHDEDENDLDEEGEDDEPPKPPKGRKPSKGKR